MPDFRWLVTHAGLLDDLGDLDEELLVLFRVLAPHEHLHGELVALDLVEILGYCLWSGLGRLLGSRNVSLGKRTFLLCGQDVQRLGGEQHQRGGELVAQQPELQKWEG